MKKPNRNGGEKATFL